MRRMLMMAVFALVLSACSEGKQTSDSESTTNPASEPTAHAEPGNRVLDEAEAEIIVNGEHLDDASQQQIEQLYQVKVKPGRYWYDPVSGVWGIEGGPGAGMMAPGLHLGGALRADASNGDTGIFVNGRQLHRLDELALQHIAFKPFPDVIG